VTAAGSTLGAGLFGAKPAETSAATSTTPAGGSLFSGFGAKKDAPANGTAAATTTPAAGTGAPRLFGGFGAKKPEGATAATTNPAATTATPGLSLFGGAAKPEEKKDAPAGKISVLHIFCQLDLIVYVSSCSEPFWCYFS
jgi:hypothetical protein